MFKSKPTPKKLLAASTKGDSSKIKRFLKAGIKLDIKDDSGKTPLHLACASGSETSVALILASGGDVLAKDSNGCIPLHLAASGKGEVIELLFEKSTKEVAQKMIEESDNSGKIALHYAVQNGNVSTTRALILGNSNIDKTDNSGKTPLEYSTSDKLKSALQKILMEKEKKDHQDSQRLLDILVRGDIATLKQIMQSGKNVNSKNLDNQSFLHISAISQLKDITLFLIDQGIDVNSTDGFKKTPLHHCAVEGISDIAEILLVQGKCDPNPKDLFDCTPLHYAAEWGRAKVIEALLNNKANIEEKDSNGCTALHQACKYGKVNALNSLLKFKPNLSAVDKQKCTPLHYAAKCGRMKIMEVLLKEQLDINAQDEDGKTALHYAAELRKDALLKSLIAQNARLDLTDNNGRTPLHSLFLWPRPRNINVTSGVEVFNAKRVPIHTNAIQFHTQCGTLLIQEALKTNPELIEYQDTDGRTILHWAIINKHKELSITLLTEAKADFTITDKQSLTPLQALTQSNYPREIAAEIESVVATLDPQAIRSLSGASQEKKKKVGIPLPKKRGKKSNPDLSNDTIENSEDPNSISDYCKEPMFQEQIVT